MKRGRGSEGRMTGGVEESKGMKVRTWEERWKRKNDKRARKRGKENGRVKRRSPEEERKR